MTTLLLTAFALAADYDLLITNARVVDGSGNPWYRASVAVKDGKIAAIGRLTGAKATETIDAQGRVLAPGFIDVHTHLEGSIELHPDALNFHRDGVTTVITGNCGSSHLDVAGFFDRISRKQFSVNIATFVGHNTVRREIMGAQKRPATPAELDRMRALVEKAMQAGAVGLSTGLEYIPGTFAPTDEIIELAKVASKYGGVYASHMRDEGEKVIEAIEETINIGRQAKIPVEISHIKQDTKKFWGMSGKMLEVIEAARREGLDVTVDQYPYIAYSTGIGLLVPSWAFAGGDGEFKKRLADPATRAKLRQEVIDMNRRKAYDDFSYVTIANHRANPALIGKTITQIAGGGDEAETILKLLEAGGGQGVFKAMSEADVEKFLQHPLVAVASDGSAVEFGSGQPHPRSYGTNARVLARYVRERGVIRLEEAIRKMTSLPAARFNLKGRGLIAEGYWADLVLFDPNKVTDQATFEKPHQYASGFDVVLVNGKSQSDGKSPAGGQGLRHQP
jgi:N-acyl-D-amino-acid deacylase